MTLYLGTSLIAGGMSAEALVDTLYPVGSCYTTTANTCPLAAIKGTWTQETTRVLVEKKEPNANDLRWYNLYSDGWCEQGFCPASASAADISTITLLKAYKDTNYDVLLSGYSGNWYPRFNSKTTTSVTLAQAMRTSWYTCGYTSTTTGHKRFRRTA